MNNITEEMNIHEEWYKEGRDMKLKKLPKFLKKLMKDYNHDYGTICHALASGAIATLWAMNNEPKGGITGFQAGFVMWEIIKNWSYRSNKSGLKLIDYDDLLYPQHKNRFDKILSKKTWEVLQKEAKEFINKGGLVAPKVLQHWESIVDGVVPFGFQVRKEGEE